MITEEQLKVAGYKLIAESMFHNGSDFFYQKRFSDHDGIRYFIDLFHYPSVVFANAEQIEESWMSELSTIEPHCTFQMHRVDDLANVEAACLCFWKAMHFKYYELNEPNQ